MKDVEIFANNQTNIEIGISAPDVNLYLALSALLSTKPDLENPE